MPEFVIYQAEAAVRAENGKLRAEIEKLKADNARLRDLVGEPQVITHTMAVSQPSTGETFTVGNCKVSIGPAGGKPAVNPMIARARANPGKGRVAPAPLQVVEQPAESHAVAEAEDGASLRFRMVELK